MVSHRRSPPGRVVPALSRLLLLLALAAPAVLGRLSAASGPPRPTTDYVAHGHEAIQINEVLFAPNAGTEWVELKNAGATAVAIQGYGLSDEDGNVYRIPQALPAVPAGARVLVRFDGQGSGSDDYNFGDGLATLHSPPGIVAIFEDDADQVALYNRYGAASFVLFIPVVAANFTPGNPPVPSPNQPTPVSPLVDFVAWGAPPGPDGAEALAAGRWDDEWYVSLYRGLGEAAAEVALAAGESIGLLPDGATHRPEDWFLYPVAEVTPGGENVRATISWYYPVPNATLDSATFAVSWAPVPQATGYQFQLDDDPTFGSPAVNVTLSEAGYHPASGVAQGSYFWRVRTRFAGGESGWSSGVPIHSLVLPAPVGARAPVVGSDFKVLGLTWQLQHKDTPMLCLDGDAETGGNAWNAVHTSHGIHGRNYCARASVAMLASYYGGHLSQDRITYESFQGGGAEGDLGHDVAYTRPQAIAAMSWALGQAVPPTMGKPTFAQIKAWIDAGQPMRAIVPGHSRVLDGYFQFTLLGTPFQFLHILDPWDRPKWVRYEDDPLLYVQVGPAGPSGAPGVRSDEDANGNGTPDTREDSDGDGVMDFDERRRFGTDPVNNDSDTDRVPELLDLREYVFDAAGSYALRNADWDHDGRRKERDPDNDQAANDGTMDGCEDFNRNGRYEALQGETDNYRPADDMLLHIRLSWPQVGSDVDLHLLKPGGSLFSSGDVYYGNRNPDWGEPGLPCDNPRLDVDCITTCTVENIRLARLENGTYSIKVHYYSDHDRGPTTAQVTVWFRGVPQTYSRTIADGQIWDVATIQWPSGTLVPIDQLEWATPTDAPARK